MPALRTAKWDLLGFHTHTSKPSFVASRLVCLPQVMEHCKGGDLFKVLMMKGGTLDEAWVCTQARFPCPVSLTYTSELVTGHDQAA